MQFALAIQTTCVSQAKLVCVGGMVDQDVGMVDQDVVFNYSMLMMAGCVCELMDCYD